MDREEGFVLRRVNYGDTGVVVTIFTLDQGVQTFVVHGVRRKKAKIKLNCFQPFTQVEVLYRKKENTDLYRLNGLEVIEPYQSIHYDFVKSAQVLFLAEVLTKSLERDDPHPDLYRWMKTELKRFDAAQKYFAEFHLYALWQWTKFLGLEPEITEKPYFHLVNAQCTSGLSESRYLLDIQQTKWLKHFLSSPALSAGKSGLSKSMRKSLTNSAIEYHRLHLDNLTNLKSYEVLIEVMDEMSD